MMIAGTQPGGMEMRVTLLEFLSSLSEAEQHTALVHLSVLWAERQGQKGNDGSV